jgi:hypothetical protein
MTINRGRILPALAIGGALLLSACDRGGTGRWATTENTSVAIDWDKVNEAYKLAEGPQDFERRVNEIYEGDEVVSVHVQDADARTQTVTGFFDRNADGKVDEPEKIFTIKRDVTGDGTAQVQTAGYGPYYGYHSPMLSIASGMLLGSMMSSAFRPAYVPIYTQPYSTSLQRASQLHSERGSYRAANPSRFQASKPSSTGKSSNSKGSSRGFGGGRSGGSRFGIARRPRGRAPERLDA